MMVHGNFEACTSSPTLDVASQQSEARTHAKHNSGGVPKFTESMKDLEGLVAQTRSEDFAAKLSYEMADPRVIDAAHALLELSHLSHLPTNELSMTMLADDNRQYASRFGGDGKMKTRGKRLQFPLLKLNNEERKQKKGKLEDKSSLSHLKKYKTSYISEEEEEYEEEEEEYEEEEEEEEEYEEEDEDIYYEDFGFLDDLLRNSRLDKEGKKHVEACESGHKRFGMEYLESKTATNLIDKHDWLCARSQKMIDEPTFSKKKLGLPKAKAGNGSLWGGKNYYPALSEKKVMDDVVVVPAKNSAKKHKLSSINPTIHTRFSFSIIHLLSAVRAVLITPYAKDCALVLRLKQCKDIQNNNPAGVTMFHSYEGVTNEEQMEQTSLTIHEIVQRVRSKPGDPCILETKEPVQDLVRGVLKIFSSRIAPLGAMGWKALTVYEKTSKSWSWIGPVPSDFPHSDHIEEETTSEAWGIPRRTLVKLVDCFANWLKQHREMLQQIRNLPPPPLILIQPLNTKNRFKDMITMKRSSTIRPSCKEVRAYFRLEETLRYLNPDRAFSYTARDGRKSTVAPLRRCSGKPSVKARGHYMLKPNRPAHFTILCLVRDAASRLPESMGTRADICTLIRDSQFVLDGISEVQVTQVVSGALDRLHYEFDPCVRYDREGQLWVYLHGEREEEDFEYDDTLSIKKGKQ